MNSEMKEELLVAVSEVRDGANFSISKGMMGYDLSNEASRYLADVIFAIIRGGKNWKYGKPGEE